MRTLASIHAVRLRRRHDGAAHEAAVGQAQTDAPPDRPPSNGRWLWADPSQSALPSSATMADSQILLMRNLAYVSSMR